jgi:hypothetical protein
MSMSGHILHTPMAETSRRPDGTRYCFECRNHREFFYVVDHPIVTTWCPLDGSGMVEFSTGAYYGPSSSIRCETCGITDSDMFPGTYREWEEPA